MNVLCISLTLVLAAGMSFGQSKVEVKPSEESQADAQAQKVQKVSEMRTVVRVTTLEQNSTSKTEIRYDEKGGIIVPGASKGIRLSRTTAVEPEKAAEKKVDARATPAPAPAKDLTSRPAHKRKGSDQ